MAKYQKRTTLESVAARRNQTLAQLVADWGVKSLDDLAKRCKREDVAMPANFTFAVSVTEVKKDELQAKLHITIDGVAEGLSKESEELPLKKARKGKLTAHEPAASDEHVGVDADTATGSEDPA